MGYLGRKHGLKSSTNVPPDVNNPPFYIPVRPIANRYTLMQELGNGSFGSVTLAKLAGSEGADKDARGQHDHKRLAASTRQHYHNTLMDDAVVPSIEQENYHNKQRGVLAIKTMMTRLPTLNDYTRVREVKFILSMPAHKNLVQIWELFIDDINYQLHIVMECMEQNLYQLMRARRKRVFSLPSLKSILSQILAGVRHIHAHNFFHRDLKPENILISPSSHYFSKEWILEGHYSDNYVVKIADYGLARHITNKSPYTAYVSTRWYRSPEILLRKGLYSRPLDIWAFGCVVVEVATFRPLFPGSDEMDQIWKILEVLGTPHTMPESTLSGYHPHGGLWEKAQVLASRLNLKFPYVEGVSIESIMDNPHLQPLCDVVKACLVWDPKKRATVDEIFCMPYFEEAKPWAEPKGLNDSNTDNCPLNDENLNKGLGLRHYWSGGLNRGSRHPHGENASLAPIEVDSNGAKIRGPKETEISFRQFLKESLLPLPMSKETSRGSDGNRLHNEAGPEDVADLPLSEDSVANISPVSSLNDAENVGVLEPPEVDDSFAAFFVSKSAEFEYPAGAEVAAGNLEPSYIHYGDSTDDRIIPHHRCNVLDDMSVDSSGSNRVPRTFAVPRISEECNVSAQASHNHSFSHTNSLTF
ncbi:protein kinase IME2 [Lachancea thermotolerans CBS 6340]|uniref:KLTH0D03080p n=1 Tax=Lachancea thermotolerans (strain ATCC 56472 / CBS 6340 / NRRL Y-8284) TaxID=559295 RepID=C5DG80_LACTC|nr:KLTH0D03080p [Lachancea thermotolerans CBS 6340]CAR22422.1 KLTH0D03080p [Lachancea thermotolerans CBS 6340]